VKWKKKNSSVLQRQKGVITIQGGSHSILSRPKRKSGKGKHKRLTEGKAQRRTGGKNETRKVQYAQEGGANRGASYLGSSDWGRGEICERRIKEGGGKGGGVLIRALREAVGDATQYCCSIGRAAANPVRYKRKKGRELRRKEGECILGNEKNALRKRRKNNCRKERVVSSKIPHSETNRTRGTS